MRIIIDYESSWRNSFLEGSNDEPIQKREFKASSKSNAEPDIKPITLNTVLGILCRLIGDQRKLYQAKEDDNFYFKNMPISFHELKKEYLSTETVMLINKSEGRPAQSSFIGTLEENEPLFFSENAYRIWGILDFNLEEIVDFIINPTVDIPRKFISPNHVLNKIRYEISLMERIEFIEDKIQAKRTFLEREESKEKVNYNKLEKLKSDINELLINAQDDKLKSFENKVKACIKVLENHFPKQNYYEKNNSILPIRLYCGAMYIMLNCMKDKSLSISKLITYQGKIRGFSERGFNGVRDFLNPLMGSKKKTVKTPYNLTKASGQLEITLDVSTEIAKELKQMIDNAGVSAFYIGKKGLAYVSAMYLQ